MDELHRTDATVLLRHWLDSVEAVEGPGGIEVEIVESIVAVYPGGALLKIFVDAPTLEFVPPCSACRESCGMREAPS